MKITCFGEVLWDLFPDYKKIGGAPLNVALRLHTMGITSSLITKIGNDQLGKDILHYIKERGLSIDTFQIDHKHATGEVLVTLDQEGTATYTISKPVAWDFIDLEENTLEVVSQSDAFIFGSLVGRNQHSYATLLILLDKSKYNILDVNLRPPHYTPSVLLTLMKKAHCIKVNEEELDEICTLFKMKTSIFEEQVKAISAYTNTTTMCITKGGKGATLYQDNTFYSNNGYNVKVLDTVGAGDSFLATLIAELLKEVDPQKSLDKACAIGAMVAGSLGANPVFSDQQVQDFISNQK